MRLKVVRLKVLYLLLFLSTLGSSQNVLRVFRPEGGNVYDFVKSDSLVVLKTDLGEYYSTNGLDFHSSNQLKNLSGRIPGNLSYSLDNGSVVVSGATIANLELPRHSIRSIEDNFIGTYNGVWLDGQKLNSPYYSSGKHYKSNDTNFICYDGMMLVSDRDTLVFVDEETGTFQFDGITYSNARDIRKLEGYYVLITAGELLLIDKDFKKVIDSIQLPFNEANRFIESLLNEFRPSLLAIAGKSITQIEIDKSGPSPRLQTNNKISFSVPIVEYHLYTDKKSDVIISTIGAHISQNAPLNTNYDTIPGEFHGAFNYRKKIFLTSNDGLYRYDSQGLNKIRSMEYNRGALQLKGDTVKIGSVEGIFVYSLTQLAYDSPLLDKKVKTRETDAFAINSVLSFKLSRNTLLLLLVLLIASVGVIYIVFQRRKVDKAENTGPDKKVEKQPTNTLEKKKEEPKTLQEQVIEYIDANLATVSNKELCFVFNMNQIKLYSLFEGTTPGKTISEKRKELAKRLISEKHDLDYIVRATGYSESYLIQTIIPEIQAAK